MSELTLPGLMEILRESAGADDSSEGPDGAGGNVSFTDMGYDSVALLETLSQVEIRYGIRFSDDIADANQTPNWMVGQINAALAAGTRT